MSERGGDAQRAVDAHTLGAENDIKPSEPVAPVEPTPPAKVVVFGSGSFGTALGTLVARNGYDGARAAQPSHAAIVLSCNRPGWSPLPATTPLNPKCRKRARDALVMHACGR
jgi:hypothetical protein